MSAFTTFYLKNVLSVLEGNVLVLEKLLRDVPGDSPRWDARPVEGRFTLREIVAHLLDYDTVARERIERMIREDIPELPNWDMDEAARHYALRDPQHDLAHWKESRRALAHWLEGLSQEEWHRKATRPGVEEFTAWESIAMMVVHDGYHLRQVTEWLALTA